jgi:hypothetical protein
MSASLVRLARLVNFTENLPLETLDMVSAIVETAAMEFSGRVKGLVMMASDESFQVSSPSVVGGGGLPECSPTEASEDCKPSSPRLFVLRAADISGFTSDTSQHELPNETLVIDQREAARSSSHWRELRCQTCHGLGTVAAFTVYRPTGDAIYNAEDVGDVLCPECKGTGLA